MHPMRSQFDANPKGAPKFWVLPLVNFISEFVHWHPELNRHPLRLFPTPVVPDGLSERDEFFASRVANEKNRLIIFEFNGARGFIEPLADYRKRKESLLSEKNKDGVTAVMVGEVGSNPIEFEQLEGWFPFEFLDVLSLATGVEVGSPWLEFRDARGGLVRRIHVRMNCHPFSRGRAAIEERIHQGTGMLLTSSQGSEHSKAPYLSGAIKNAVRGGPHNTNLPSRLSHLFRCLDGLCQVFVSKRQRFPNQQNRDLVERLVEETGTAIRRLAREVEEKGDREEGKLLERIARQVAGAKNARVGFGDAVVLLMREYGLNDPDVMQEYYRQKPRLDNRDWCDVLSYYRGIVMHGGQFDVSSGKHDIDDLLATAQHLHDVLIRILLKMFGYRGEYQPTVVPATASEGLGWVKSDTSAVRLGYLAQG